MKLPRGVNGNAFRPYQPDQMLLLPQDLREWVGRSPGAPCERPGGRAGSESVLRAVRGGRAAQLALRSADDGEGAGHGYATGTFSSRKPGGGHRLSDAGGGQLSGTGRCASFGAAICRISGRSRRWFSPRRWAWRGSPKVRANASKRKAITADGQGGAPAASGDCGAARLRRGGPRGRAADELKRREDRLAAPRSGRRRRAWRPSRGRRTTRGAASRD